MLIAKSMAMIFPIYDFRFTILDFRKIIHLPGALTVAAASFLASTGQKDTA